MEIKTKYNIGDVVKIEEMGIKKVRNTPEKCSFCNGSGIIQGDDLSVLKCPICLGEKVTIRKGAISYIQGEIGQIIINSNNNIIYILKEDGKQIKEDDIIEVL